MTDIRTRALAAIREGRVLLKTVATDPDERAPHFVCAVVYGHTGRHRVTYGPTMAYWNCSSCGQARCAHIAAVALVSGDPSLARKGVAA